MFRREKYPIVLILVSSFLCFKSWVSGTWLSGWDTLHPEFNFKLAFERLIFGVFRGEQGLGAVAAHSHMADLPRVILLFLASLILPASTLRYFFISLCLIVGTIGAFVFIKRILLKNAQYSGAFAFLGGLFYLLNLGTLQQFYVPFEMFTVQFAALPWLFYFATEFIFQPKKRNLAFFGLVTLLGTPMAFASTLWFAYFLAFTLYLGVFLKKHFKQTALLVVLTLMINSFWLLPNLYFVFSGNAGFVSSAKTNKIFSQEAFAFNKNYGTFADTLILRNFLLDWSVYDNRQEHFIYLFNSWREYLSKPQVLAIGYLLSVIALVGIIFGAIGRSRVVLALILPMVLAVVFLINQNPPLDLLFVLFREKIPLFGEAMRFPFTKFAIILMFTLACFFALGQNFLHSILTRISHLRFAQALVLIQLIIFSALFFFYMKPLFLGDFISKKIQVTIPPEYFEMFKWFDSQPDGRVAAFPVHSFWGWIYYQWGFQGAQFISFGIKQPLMDRDFDRWNLSNEQAYREISYAVYSQDAAALDKVLQKYQIAYLLLDRNVLAPGANQDKGILFFDQTQSLFTKLQGRIIKARDFGKISVYQIKNPPQKLRAASRFTAVSTGKRGADVDWVYRDLGDYAAEGKPAFIYPFYALSDNQNFLSLSFKKEANLLLKKDQALPKASWLVDYLNYEQYLPVEVYARQNDNNLQVRLTIKLLQTERSAQFDYPIPGDTLNNNWIIGLDDNQTLSGEAGTDFKSWGRVFLSTKTTNNLSFYPAGAFRSLETNSSPFFQPDFCNLPNFDQQVGLSISGSSIKITAKNTSACVRVSLADLFQPGQLDGSQSLLKLSFKVDSPDGKMTGHYCWFDRILQRCAKEKNSLGEGQVTDYLPLVGDINRWDLVLFANNTNKSETKEISYQNLKFEIGEPATNWTLTPQDLKSQLHNQTLNLSGMFDFWASLKDLPGSNISMFESGHLSTSCWDNVPKKFNRVLNPKEGYIEYSATGGFSCDFFAFPNLPHNLGYLLSLETKNLAGLPLRLCLLNTFTKRCDIFSTLPSHKNFAEDAVVIPPIDDGGAGYELHFDNYSVGNIASVNQVRQMKLTPFPYYWLTKFRFPASADSASVNSSLQIKSFKKILPMLFVAEVANPSPQHGLLVLDHSFEKGWWASLGQHVLVNNWANGWLIEGGKYQKMIIFYWPQALEVIGFVLVIVGFVWVMSFLRMQESN